MLTILAIIFFLYWRRYCCRRNCYWKHRFCFVRFIEYSLLVIVVAQFLSLALCKVSPKLESIEELPVEVTNNILGETSVLFVDIDDSRETIWEYDGNTVHSINDFHKDEYHEMTSTLVKEEGSGNSYVKINHYETNDLVYYLFMFTRYYSKTEYEFHIYDIEL